MNASRYARPPLAWIKRRARNLMAAFRLDRRAAICEASVHYLDFVGGQGGVH